MTEKQKTYLLIPFDKKDELKKLHKIRWDTEKKLWFIDEMVEGLKPYSIKKIVIPYESKDIVKEKYKNIRFEKETKSWLISLKDYNDYLGK
jgi:transposase